MKRGFTLIEMLVVIGVLSIFGTLILSIFSKTLQGGNKSKIEGIIKQNGQSVLEQMDKTVRNADNVVCPTASSSQSACTSAGCSWIASSLSCQCSSSNLVVVNKGTYTRFRFIAPSPSPNPTSNGLIEQDNPIKQPDLAGKEETDSAFVTRVCDLSNPMVNPTILTDTNTQTGVSSENYSFLRDKSAGVRDQVTIKFDLKPAVLAPAAIRGQINTVTFQTTIGLR